MNLSRYVTNSPINYRDRPEIQEINEYALDLEDKIALKDDAELVLKDTVTHMRHGVSPSVENS